MADYDIFREQLGIRFPTYGHALWDPSPWKPEKPVKVGDVGFIRRGKFHRLFNVLCPKGEQSDVPEGYEQLVPRSLDHITQSSLNGGHYCSIGVSVQPELDIHSSGPDAFREVSIEYSGKRGGAVLSLPVKARREDTLAQSAFSEWIVKHIDRWFAFAQDLQFGIEMEDIILVTGCDHARSWTNVAFLKGKTDAKGSFKVKAVRRRDASVEIRFSSGYIEQGVLNHGPEGENPTEDQCVFIRGFRVARTHWKLTKQQLKAAAGPSRRAGGYDFEPETGLISIPAGTAVKHDVRQCRFSSEVPKFQDPLRLLQDYIAEHARDCDMVLVHDDDLKRIGGIGDVTSLETLQPEVMIDLFRKSNIETMIYRADCALSPVTSSPEPDAADIIRVAMLSTVSQEWPQDACLRRADEDSSLYSSTLIDGSEDLHDNPLSSAIRPLGVEAELEHRIRRQMEPDAKRISDIIDEQLKMDSRNYDKSKQDVRLLFLGQAESGKSTLRKQFQRMYSPERLDQERAFWRVVVYFNIARVIKRILEGLESHGDTFEDVSESPVYGSVSPKQTLEGIIRQDVVEDPSTSRPFSASAFPVVTKSQKDIGTLRLSLSPLVAAEAHADMLGLSFVGPFHGTTGALPSPVVEGVGSILDASKEDVKALWRSDVVQKMINQRRHRLEEWAEFFLGAIDRVAARDYIPSTDDILHARIQTVGVTEHLFEVPLHGRTVTWHIYDVGGGRGQRQTWVPYFEKVNAVIFVAPISAFDQYLDEDPRVNRIDDSLQTFTAICSNKLLMHIHLVLVLNKTDVLQAKLAKGVRVGKYITSYGNRPNDYEAVANYFRAHFLQVHRKNNGKKRVLYTHLTNALDIQATRTIVAEVHDSLSRNYLKSAALV